ISAAAIGEADGHRRRRVGCGVGDPAILIAMNCRYDTALEPGILIRQFVAYPPEGFDAAQLPSGVPVFVTDFDLTTTLDKSLGQRLKALPGHRHWQRWLHWRTRFVGCTATEYMPLPHA